MLHVGFSISPASIRHSGLVADRSATDYQRAGRTQDPERAPGHAERAVVGVRDGLQFELAIDLAKGRTDL